MFILYLLKRGKKWLWNTAVEVRVVSVLTGYLIFFGIPGWCIATVNPLVGKIIVFLPLLIMIVSILGVIIPYLVRLTHLIFKALYQDYQKEKRGD